MQGIYTIASRLTGAVQFDPTNPIVTFLEFAQAGGAPNANLNVLPPSMSARIVGYAYTSLGDPHAVRLTLRPTYNVIPNLDQEIILRNEASVSTFGSMCGPDGIVVPRNFGIAAVDQQPPVATITTAETFRVFLSTTGKTDAATFFLWYRIVGEDQ